MDLLLITKILDCAELHALSSAK